VTSDPPRATVVVDGSKRGTTPLVVTDLQPGLHDIVVTGTTGRVRQRVAVEADTMTTVMVPLPKRGAGQHAGGWVTVRAPLELRIFEDDRLVGTTAMSRLMLPTGRHTLRLTNGAAGVDITREVSIGSGQTAILDVILPPGTLSVNALPWAQVSIDGRDMGETPLGGIELLPGPHDVVFRHPELGERRQPVTIRAGAHSRVSMDLRR
jgi:serine/threonine-protein kinase